MQKGISPRYNSRREGVKIKQFIEILEIKILLQFTPQICHNIKPSVQTSTS